MLQETLEYLGIAFICSVLLIIMSKIILQALIRRPADYYNAGELREEELMLNAGGISITNEHETNPAGEIIEEAHLVAQLGDSEPAEPEEIIPEIPASVHESIEVTDDESEDGKEATESIERHEDTEELQEEISPVPEKEEMAGAVSETAVDPDTSNQAEQSTEDQFGFSIKAKTSRTPKPRNKQAEEAEEEIEQARAAIDVAKTSEAASKNVSEWTESYADIRKSLEKAFTERASASDTADVPEDNKAELSAAIKPKPAPKKKNSRRRTPSMNMNKKELTEIAESRGIAVPPEATKREILDLIYADRRKRY